LCKDTCIDGDGWTLGQINLTLLVLLYFIFILLFFLDFGRKKKKKIENEILH